MRSTPTVLITGASSGIGAVARELARMMRLAGRLQATFGAHLTRRHTVFAGASTAAAASAGLAVSL